MSLVDKIYELKTKKVISEEVFTKLMQLGEERLNNLFLTLLLDVIFLKNEDIDVLVRCSDDEYLTYLRRIKDDLRKNTLQIIGQSLVWNLLKYLKLYENISKNSTSSKVIDSSTNFLIQKICFPIFFYVNEAIRNKKTNISLRREVESYFLQNNIK